MQFETMVVRSRLWSWEGFLGVWIYLGGRSARTVLIGDPQIFDLSNRRMELPFTEVKKATGEVVLTGK